MDLWSLGAVLAELALHRPLFPAHSPNQLLQQVCLHKAAVLLYWFRHEANRIHLESHLLMQKAHSDLKVSIF